MKNFDKSDYALNKFSEGIVYKFSNEIREITKEQYLRENPNKTEGDFLKLKEISDEIFLDEIRYYKYGKYVDMTSFGFDETYNYYDYGGMEAIAKGGWSGTADQIGKQITEIIKESDNHWRYVGSNDYSYIAVGAAYNADTDCKWYACIIVSATNEYE